MLSVTKELGGAEKTLEKEGSLGRRAQLLFLGKRSGVEGLGWEVQKGNYYLGKELIAGGVPCDSLTFVGGRGRRNI